jgi:N6-adenosine-specific RNA methylase IME4
LRIHNGSAATASQDTGAQLAAKDLLGFAKGCRFGTILADPPWRFDNRTGKVAPEHKRLSRYGTMDFAEIQALPVAEIAAPVSHLYLWCPNALLPNGIAVLQAWGFQYKGNIVRHKIRKDGGPDGRGVGFYFRNVTELIMFGIHGKPGARRAHASVSVAD